MTPDVGPYGVRLVALGSGHVVASASGGFTVPYSPEYRYLGTDRTFLAQVAVRGGGALLGDAAAAAAVALPRSSVVVTLAAAMLGAADPSDNASSYPLPTAAASHSGDSAPGQNAAMIVEPFRIQVDDEVVSDLRRRILATRWPAAAPGPAWGQGTDLAYLKSLLADWSGGFDWRAEERRINRIHQFRAYIDGVAIHFVHERAVDGSGIPLLLLHGWPSTFVELLPLVTLLTDPGTHGVDGPAFDLVIPSLPGYGFSERPERGNYRDIAGLMHSLMRGLG